MADLPACRLCLGLHWLCTQHPDRPWPHGDCPGPGEPCPLCRNSDPIDRILIDDLDDPDGNVH